MLEKSPIYARIYQLIRLIHCTANLVSSQTTMLHKLHTFLTIILCTLTVFETFFHAITVRFAQTVHIATKTATVQPYDGGLKDCA